VAHDAEDAICGNEELSGRDDVKQQGAAADLVEDLGALAFEAGALASGHDGDGKAVCCYGGIHGIS
jgi:hypothetical protein